MQMEQISLTWSVINDEKAALTFFKELDQKEKSFNLNFQKSDGFEAGFKESFTNFKNDSDLKWDQVQPLVICWSLRLNLNKPIKDILIDKTDSISASYEQYMKEEDHFDYSLIDEIVNRLKELIIEVYETHIPFNFNELFETFFDQEESFGFDLYQLNATNTSEDEIFIIDVDSAQSNGVFPLIIDEVVKRIKLRRR